MIILAIKTDQPRSELSLYDGQNKIATTKWQAHGTLAETINRRIEKLLSPSSARWAARPGYKLSDIDGIVCFEGPGSFTGLRIGLSVANALAYAQNIPVVAAKGENWLETGIKDLQVGKNQNIVSPFYGRPAATTKAKK